MIEILWHGRGGQGAFTAARLLGAASSLAKGRYALAFPSFGPERRGAPMRAFTKLSNEPIGDRSAITQADFVVYLDDTLVASNWDRELKPDGIMLVNSTEAFEDSRVIALDANGISEEILGRPIPNTVFLGALATLCDQIALEDVQEAIRQYMDPKLHESNIAIVQAAARRTEELMQGMAGVAATAAAGVTDADNGDVAAMANKQAVFEGTCTVASQPPRPSATVLPTLRSVVPQPKEYARSTCYEAGYLVEKNAGWRNMRPAVNRDACTGCLQCYLQCPDGAIYPIDVAALERESGATEGSEQTKKTTTTIAIDYDFCKGCGVCVHACKFAALAMVSEREALAREEV